MGHSFSRKHQSKKKEQYVDAADSVSDETAVDDGKIREDDQRDERCSGSSNEHQDILVNSSSNSKEDPILNLQKDAIVSRTGSSELRLEFAQEHPCMYTSSASRLDKLALPNATMDEEGPDEVFEENTSNTAVGQKPNCHPVLRKSVSTEQELTDDESQLEDSEEDPHVEEVKDYVVQKRAMSIVAHNIGNEWKPLARELITDPEVDAIQQKEDGIENMTYEAIRKWKQHNPQTATVRILACHLETIGRPDIANQIITELSHQKPEPASVTQSGQTESSLKQLLLQINQNLKSNYQALSMKGLPWMKDIVLTLEDYYVDLVLAEGDQRGREAAVQTHIEDIFNVTHENNCGLRILVEGGPGSGKTTLAAKLAYDWSKGENYISHFDVVLLIPVRLFKGNWKMALKQASLVRKKDKNSFLRIIDCKSNSVLIILDGYDEASMQAEQKILPLLKRDLYPHVSVIVTSRRGKFTCTREEAGERTYFVNVDVAPVFTRFLDKRVIVKGFSEQQQWVFIDKHMESFSEQEKDKVRTKLDKMVDKEFLACPLFLLMLIVVFTSDEDVKNTDTKTGLYKHIFNLVIKRYFSKIGSSSVHSIDLFSCNEIGENPPHIVLMTQFSQFALKALKSNSHVFTRDEIVTTYNCDPRILDLGFLKQNLSVKGFREFLTYEPVHKSLLEFAAAYGLHLSHRHDNRYQFISEVTTFRPGDSYASLFFPFLMGLLQENAGVLFSTIISYAFEYSCKFEYLQSTLMETELTDDILKSLTPFLPPKWKILSTSSGNVAFENCFLTSSQHKALLRWGVQQGKIRQISWDLLQDAILSSDVVVDTLVLDMRCIVDINNMLHSVRNNSQYSLWKKTHKKLHCKYLWCTFFNSFCDTSESLKSFLDCLNFIDFQQISFEFSHNCVTEENKLLYGTNQQIVPHIYKVVTEGKLRNVRMYNMSDATCTHASSMLNAASKLIEAERLQSLEMYVSNAEQNQIELFLRCAANSSYLRNLVFGTKPCCAESNELPFTVNLAKLCEDGQKSWEWVELAGLKVECTENSETSFLIRHLDVSTCSVVTTVMQQCHIKSLNCPASLLAFTSSRWPYQASLTELSITVDIALIYRGLYSFAEKLQNLQILALTMAPVGVLTPSLPFDQWLWSALSLLHLKGFEIWSFSKNTILAKDLVEGLVQCLEGRPSSAISGKDFYERPKSWQSQVSHTEQLQLEYLMLGDTESESGHHATWCLPQLKTCLQCRRLQHLDVVFSTENKNPESFQLRSIFLATKVFPREEGFTVEHDLWGSKADDSIYSRGKHRMSLTQRDRISVTFQQRRPPNNNGSHFPKEK